MNKSIEIVLGLGSNLGNRANYLKAAIMQLQDLKAINQVTLSSIYQTKALLKPDSPHEWNLDYLNMAIRGITQLSPLELLETVKKIEQDLGRKSLKNWSPREIDIDILVYGEQVINQPDLIIPHLGLLDRPWCLIPLAAIYPEWKYPVIGPYYKCSAQELINKLKINDLDLYHSSAAPCMTDKA